MAESRGSSGALRTELGDGHAPMVAGLADGSMPLEAIAPPAVAERAAGAAEGGVLVVCSPDSHGALKRDDLRWLALPLVGIQPDEDDQGRPMPLELRNCRCGTTLARRSLVPLAAAEPGESADR